MFADMQVVPFRYVARRLKLEYDAVNAGTAPLTRNFRQIVNDESANFYAYIEDTRSWTVTYESFQAQRRALR